jgi:hypothetical protein
MLNKIGETLADVIGKENADNFVSMCSRIKERAVERQSEQTVSLIFNPKGFVRHINGSDNVNGVKPKGYVAE